MEDQKKPTTVAPAPQPIPTLNTPLPSNKLAGRKKLLAIIALVIVVIGGVGAAAYYGVIVPNKPQNKLVTALTNLTKQESMHIDGKIDYADKRSGGQSFSMDFAIDSDLAKQQLGLSGDLGVKGASILYDLRYIDKNIYIKVGGLDGISSILGSNPQAAQYGALLSRINNKWYVVDRSLIQASPEASCSADVSWMLTDDDRDKIKAAYEKYPLFTIKGQTSADVDGVATTKMELDPGSDETAQSFGKELESLSMISKFKECAKNTGAGDQFNNDQADSEDSKGKFFVYITSDKQVKKIELSADDETLKVAISLTFDFKDVVIEKPEGALPFQEILGGLYSGAPNSGVKPATGFESLFQ